MSGSVGTEQAFGRGRMRRGRKVRQHPTASNRITSTRLNRGAMG